MKVPLREEHFCGEKIPDRANVVDFSRKSNFSLKGTFLQSFQNYFFQKMYNEIANTIF